MAKNKEIKKAGAAQGQSRSKQSDSSKGAAKQPAKGSSSREADARDAGKQEARDGAFISAEQVSPLEYKERGAFMIYDICVYMCV